MADTPSFTKLVPGFEFLQSLVKNAGSSLPSMGHWVAPTLNPEEIEKRIEELRTVKFWLEQNGRMLDATIQALEVQRMTLTTLKTMNLQMGDLRESMMIRPNAASASASGKSSNAAAGSMNDAAATAMAAATQAATAFASAFQFPKPAASAPPAESHDTPSPIPTPSHPLAPDREPIKATASPATPEQADSEKAVAPAASKTSGAVDPMQWWGALTKQFATLATAALQDSVGTHTPVAPAKPSSARSKQPSASTSASRSMHESTRSSHTPPPRTVAKRSAPPGAATALAKSVAPPRKKAVRKSPAR
ncbi:hypothetical protein BH09PSE5_BH09PSE5_39210 [soil metagenome]